jgi:hypothetical protein
MTNDLYKKLYADGLISDLSFEKLNQKGPAPLFSIHWELKLSLYLGVLLLTTGLGLLVYENIDSIGHTAVLVFIALISITCFIYCFKNKLPFSREKVDSPNTAFDYVLLLASTSFLIFVGYLQYQYNVFGSHYGMATFIPMVVLFFIAYYFDHLGILSMAIANLAVWMGVSVTPKQLLHNYDFDSKTIIFTYLLLGVLLLSGAYATQYFKFKKHFKFSYQHYGVHAAYIAMLAGYFHYYESPVAAVWMLGIALLSFFLYSDAFKNKSFYFLLLMMLYSYIALSSLVIRMLSAAENVGALSFLFFYFIASGIGLIFLLIYLNKKLNTGDSL